MPPMTLARTSLRHRSGRQPRIATLKACSSPAGIFWVVRYLRIQEASTSIFPGQLRISPVFLNQRRERSSK
jgi:hypothetical protein